MAPSKLTDRLNQPDVQIIWNFPVSYIDIFDHEFVGYFGGTPVYHPIEVVPRLPTDGPEDFGCGPENLVIGGGSGEAPAIVVKQPGETVKWFVRSWINWCTLYNPPMYTTIAQAAGRWPDSVPPQETEEYWSEVFEFAGWQLEYRETFTTRCASQAFSHPYCPDDGTTLERWIAESVGEFVLYAMPELAALEIQRLGELRGHIAQELYGNILLLPPGYPVWGRREVNKKVVWGLSAWDIHRAQTPHTIR